MDQPLRSISHERQCFHAVWFNGKQSTNVLNLTQVMNAFLWVTQVVLALLFFYSGLMKSTQSEEKLVAMGQTGVAHLPRPFIRFIGIAELAGVLGLMLPEWLRYWPVLTPVAAGCLGLIMLPAGVIHYRRGEFRAVVLNGLVFILCGVIVYGRGTWLSH